MEALSRLTNLLVVSTIIVIGLTRYAPSYLYASSTPWTLAVAWLATLMIWSIFKISIYPSLISPLRTLPTAPGAIPIMGHWDVHSNFAERTRAWGNSIPNNGLVRYLYWFNRERVLVTSPRVLAELLVTKNSDFAKPPVVRSILEPLLGDSLLLAEGEEHKRQRKSFSPAFSYRHIKDLYPVFWAKSTELVQRILSDIAGPRINSEGECNVLEMHDYASRASLDNIGLAGMGHDFDTVANPENELHKHYKMALTPTRTRIFLQLAAFLVPMWILELVPLKQHKLASEARKHIRETSRMVIKKKRELLEKGHTTDVDIISVALQEGKFSDEELINQVMTFLVAGHSTTGVTLMWALYLLCDNIGIQERLRKELHANLPFSAFAKGGTVSSEDIEGMPYLKAVCNEVLRHLSPVTIGMRAAIRDTSIGGHPIPKGTFMVSAPWLTNNSISQWGADALSFNPDRWLTKSKTDPETVQANHTGGAESNYSFLTFSHGPRNCIGEKFARAEFACLLAALVARLEFEFKDPGFKPRFSAGIIVGSKDGMWLRVKECPQW